MPCSDTMQPDHRWIVVVLALGAALVVLLFFEMLNRWLSRRAAWFHTVVTIAIAVMAATRLAGAPRWRQWSAAALLIVPAGWLAIVLYTRSVHSRRKALDENEFADSTPHADGEGDVPRA
jgi:quinol-cytochrome oxidoreductase complex cytochrome b subunit